MTARILLATLVAVLLAVPAAAHADGTLAPPQTYPLHSGSVTDVDAGDVTSDGRVDVLGAQPDSGVVDTLRQLAPALPESRPAFAVQRFVEGIGYATAVGTGDWDGDDDVDAVVAAGGTLRTFVNDGGGVLASNPMENRAIAGDPQDIVVVDVNDDGDPDLLLPETNGGFSWSALLGQPGHGWGTRADYQNGGEIPRGLAVADFTGDGHPDVAAQTTLFGSGALRVRVWHGSPDGNFTLGAALDSGSGDARHSVAAGDMSGDGDPEVVAVAGDQRSIWTGGAAGSFSAPAVTTLPRGSRSAALGDLDRDGDADLVTVDDGLQRVRVQLTEEGGTVGPETLYPTGEGADAIELQLEDLDGDGGLDLYTANDNTTASVLHNEVTANLGVTLTDSPDPVAGGQTVTYTAQVENAGPDVATDAELVFVTPVGSAEVSMSPGCAHPPIDARIICDLGDMDVGDTATRTFVVRFGSAGTATATAAARSRERDPVSANDLDTEDTTVSSAEPPSDLDLTVLDEPDPAGVGQAITWTATIENDGAGAARDVVLTDDIPVGTSFVSAMASAGSCTKLAARVRCELGTLPASGTASVVVRAIPQSAGTLDNLFEVTTSSPETGAGANARTARTTVGSGGGEPTGPIPGISVSDVAVAEGDEGNVDAAFTVSLSAATGRQVSVDYRTSSGTAVDGPDFSGRGPGTLLFQPGQTTKAVAVPVHGDTADEPNEQFTLVVDAPVNGTLTDAVGVGTITDDDLAPPTLEPRPATATEATGAVARTVSFPVRLSRAVAHRVTVDYATVQDTARTGTDFTAAVGSLTFLAGQTEKTVSVPVVNDDRNETDERFSLELSAPVGATLAPSRADGTIHDDDAEPLLRIAPGEQVVAEAGGARQLTFDVTLSQPSGRSVSASWTTRDGTATAPRDFTARTGSLTLAAGETAKQVTVSMHDDAYDEDDRQSFSVELLAASGAELDEGRATVAIEDDDPIPYLRVQRQQSTLTTVEGGTLSATWEVSDQPTERPVRFRVRLLRTEAGEGDVDTFDTAVLTTAPGAGRRHTVTAPTKQDAVDEDDERVRFDVVDLENAQSHPADGPGTGATADVTRHADLRATITDDDDPPSVSIEDAVGEEGGGVRFAVRLSERSERPVSFRVTTSAGTAQPHRVEPVCLARTAGGFYPTTDRLGRRIESIDSGQTDAAGNRRPLEVGDLYAYRLDQGSAGAGPYSPLACTEQLGVFEVGDFLPLRTGGSRHGLFYARTEDRPFTLTPPVAANHGFTPGAQLGIRAGELLADVAVSAHADGVSETDEAFTVSLSDVVDASVARATATGVIVAAGGAPRSSIKPSLDPEDPQVGSAVTCDPGRWTGSPSGYTYRWQVNASSVSGATAPTFTPRAADVAKSLRCIVTAINGAGVGVASSPTAVVVAAAASAPAGGGVVSRGGTTTVEVGCAAGGPVCNGIAELTTSTVARASVAAPRKGRRTQLGRARFRIPAGRTKAVRVKLTRAGLRRVRRTGRVRVVARVSMRRNGRMLEQTTKPYTLRASRRPGRS